MKRRKVSGYRIEEAYKTLRTNLQFSGEDKKVIVFTSCTPGEGKSSVSLQIAISLAESGKKVLFIDADLRKSVLLGRIRTGGQNVKGLTHFLTGQAKLEDVMCTCDVPGLQLIFSGPFPPNPTELLGGKNFHLLILGAKKVYDYVIIDTPPLGYVIDSAVVARECDGAVIVIESGKIGYRVAQEVKEQLQKSNCPILGAVLNKADIHTGKYGKYYQEYKQEH